MKKRKVFIACDTGNQKVIRRIISLTKTNKLEIGYKFGLEFLYTKNGRNFISNIKNKNIFADYKISDIPSTSSAAIKSLKDLRNLSYIIYRLLTVLGLGSGTNREGGKLAAPVPHIPY